MPSLYLFKDQCANTASVSSNDLVKYNSLSDGIVFSSDGIVSVFISVIRVISGFKISEILN